MIYNVTTRRTFPIGINSVLSFSFFPFSFALPIISYYIVSHHNSACGEFWGVLLCSALSKLILPYQIRSCPFPSLPFPSSPKPSVPLREKNEGIGVKVADIRRKTTSSTCFPFPSVLCFLLPASQLKSPPSVPNFLYQPLKSHALNLPLRSLLPNHLSHLPNLAITYPYRLKTLLLMPFNI